MVEIRAALLPVAEPLWIRRNTLSLADAAVRPLRRGLFIVAAFSLPVLGSAAADRFHGSASGTSQVVAVPLSPPQSGAAASSSDFGRARIVRAKFAQSLSAQ